MASGSRRQVCTPCYRAPEVVINRGRYDAAMDMWSVGCIFGELLHRMERSGSSFTPKLTIEPVFKLSPNTPRTPSMTTTFRDDQGLAKRVRLPVAPWLLVLYAACFTPWSGRVSSVLSPFWLQLECTLRVHRSIIYCVVTSA
jgi:mitogen-activated protein kinase 1/3